MKIGIDASRVRSQDRTGTENYSFWLIKNLLPLLSEYEVILYTREDLPDEIFPQNQNNISIVQNGQRFMWSQTFLPLRAQEDHLDLLFVPSHVLPFLYRGKTLLTIHGLEYELVPSAYSFFQKLYLRVTTRFGLDRSCEVIVPSAQTAELLEELYDADHQKISVISHGGILSQLADVSEGSNAEKQYFFYIGRQETRKGFFVILQAFKDYVESGGKNDLVIAGAVFGKAEQTVNELGLVDRVNFVGYVNDARAAQLLKGSRALVFPSRAEGFGMPVLDALQMGVPVISSSVGFARDFLAGDQLQCECVSRECVLQKMRLVDEDFENISADYQQKKEYFQKFTWKRTASEHFIEIEKCLKGV